MKPVANMMMLIMKPVIGPELPMSSNAERLGICPLSLITAPIVPNGLIKLRALREGNGIKNGNVAGVL